MQPRIDIGNRPEVEDSLAKRPDHSDSLEEKKHDLFVSFAQRNIRHCGCLEGEGHVAQYAALDGRAGGLDLAGVGEVLA
jgi:hypothetical protein